MLPSTRELFDKHTQFVNKTEKKILFFLSYAVTFSLFMRYICQFNSFKVLKKKTTFTNWSPNFSMK